MTATPVTPYLLFNGSIRTINTALGINQNPTVVTTTVVEDSTPVSVTNRQFVHISIGKFDFRGIVQSWSQAVTDIAGTGIYNIRITDTKPVLDAAQVIIGSSFNEARTQAYAYGDNVIPIVFQTASQKNDGIPFSVLQTAIEGAQIKYGSEVYTVNFNFTLPNRGSSVEYSLKSRAMSLLELISQAANDNGLDWYVTTSANKVISVNMFGRTNVTSITIDQLAALHQDAVIRRHQGQENRDAIQKVVLTGGYRTYLHKVDGSLWEQFWGFDEYGRKRREPLYSETVMEQVINNDFTSEDYKEEDVQKILSYANEFWGRKFIGLITPPTVIGSDGRSWVTPTSAAWYESDDSPLDYDDTDLLDRDGQLKFQTEDGRWVTFAALPLPGTRYSTKNVKLNYQWDDELFSNPNSHIDKNGNISIKASSEIIDGFDEMEYWLEQFIIYLLNLDDDEFISLAWALSQFFLLNPEISIVVRLDFLRLINSNADTIIAIAEGDLIYTDAVKNSIQEGFSDQYFVLTLATPLRVRTITKETIINETTGFNEQSDVITKTRLTNIENAFLALLDQRETYGPWQNRQNSQGRTEVIIDSSLTPWSFGFRGIINSTGIDIMNEVALGRIKTVLDISLDAATAELEVAGLPAVNIGDQLQTTGTITAIGIVFGINGIKTTYRSLQHTTELSKYLRQQQRLLDKLRRQAAEFNNTMQPIQDIWETDRVIRTLKKELPEPPVDVSTEGNRRQAGTLLGRIESRVSNTEPKYNITPMVWVADIFGELTLVRDPKVFGIYTRVVNMSEKQTSAGRLLVGTDVQVREFFTTDGGITSYYMEVSAPPPPSFSATINQVVSNSQPRYKVTPISNSVQQLHLLASELNALNSVLNIGEPENFTGYLSINSQVTINWNENDNGSYTPFIEQQVNFFKPLD
ncbi:hypothetical protein LCGC14_0141610 [marine sediment metagenome]|uniref:Uncharacterized protein n=1 Tax=marine sediment metagenome TaxID=412755 RepID=A0A0F9XIA8_9ZZZZ